MEKQIKVKPMFYSVILEPLKKIAIEFGYNLVIHGSMNRYLDLVLIPWVDKCTDSDAVIKVFAEFLGAKIIMQDEKGKSSLSKVIFNGAGRKSYLINLNRNDRFKEWVDKEYYLDISVTPKVGE